MDAKDLITALLDEDMGHDVYVNANGRLIKICRPLCKRSKPGSRLHIELELDEPVRPLYEDTDDPAGAAQ